MLLRNFINRGFLAAAGLMLMAASGAALGGEKHHALSLVGAPKYGPEFTHFDWINPDAPKGGRVRQSARGTYDSFNPFILNANPAFRISLIYDTLMESSADEPSTEYGLIAEWVSYPDDFSSATFHLRETAKFHDGKQITPEDVIFSMEMLKKINPQYAFYYKNVVNIEKTAPREVTFRFDVKNNRELPLIIGQLAILPKHYWTGKKADGTPRDLTKTTLEPPLGSGPYKIGKFETGKYISYERVPEYWARDLAVKKGQHNFDELRWDYFRDSTIAFEAFRAGKLDFYRETSSKNWATAYDFKTVKNGLIKKEKITLKAPVSMQCFAFNTRRAHLSDPRVRRAFNLAFDFEWANKNLFYGQYARVSSYFQNTELAATGLPQGRELEILNELKGEIPEAVFTTEYKNPDNSKPRAVRGHLGQAIKLLGQAGWKNKGGKLINAKTGEQMKVEFLLVSPLFERIVLPYIRNLKKLGIKASVRTVDSSQYVRRFENFDFDIVVGNFGQSHSPGNEQREYWGSNAADKKGSRNIIGIKNPAIDKLIDKIIFAKSREELVAVTNVLDRVLLANHYVVPQWYVPYERTAYWDMYAHPKKYPSQLLAFERIWWFDADAATKLAAKRGK